MYQIIIQRVAIESPLVDHVNIFWKGSFTDEENCSVDDSSLVSWWKCNCGTVCNNHQMFSISMRTRNQEQSVCLKGYVGSYL